MDRLARSDAWYATVGPRTRACLQSGMREGDYVLAAAVVQLRLLVNLPQYCFEVEDLTREVQHCLDGRATP